MAEIITCPHCGKLESWKGEAHTHCAFCKQPLSGPRRLRAVDAEQPPAPPEGSRVLKWMAWGGLWGGGMAGAIWCCFFALPVLQALAGNGDFPDATVGGSPSSPLLAATLGVAAGSMLMAAVAAVLHTRPRSVRAIFWGGVAGAFGGFILGFPVLALLRAQTHFWLISEGAAAVGGLLGMGFLFCCEGMRIAVGVEDD